MLTESSATNRAFTSIISLQLLVIVVDTITIVLIILCAEGALPDLIRIRSRLIVCALRVWTSCTRMEVISSSSFWHPGRFAAPLPIVIWIATCHQLLSDIIFTVIVRLRCRWCLLLNSILSNRLLLLLLLLRLNWHLRLLIISWWCLWLLRLRFLSFLGIELKHFLVESHFLSMKVKVKVTHIRSQELLVGLVLLTQTFLDFLDLLKILSDVFTAFSFFKSLCSFINQGPDEWMLNYELDIALIVNFAVHSHCWRIWEIQET